MLLHLALRWGGKYLQYFCDSNFTILRILGDRPNRQPNQLIYFDYDEPACSEIKLFTLVQPKPAELNQDPNSPKLTPRFRGSEIHPVIHGKLARQISWANQPTPNSLNPRAHARPERITPRTASLLLLPHRSQVRSHLHFCLIYQINHQG
jgi:hypothetical protein